MTEVSYFIKKGVLAPAAAARSVVSQSLFFSLGRNFGCQSLLILLLGMMQMFPILEASNLQRLRVFLVIDNLSSQESIESVQAILQLGVGAGSRVILVARTLEILEPLLNISEYYHGHTQYVCDSMRVPSINEKEASCVLMQPAGGLGLASDYMSKMEENFSSSHTEVLAQAARLCAFRTQSPHYAHQDLLYLPLALKLVGSQLRSNGMNLEKWGRQLLQLDTTVKELKEDAVRKIVEESYENLPKNLKLMFLDVALLMVPYSHSYIEYEVAVELLSFMHECNADTIRRQVKELVRLCFLDLGSSSDEIIIVHGVFLEFAKSVPDASSMYYCKRKIAGVQVTFDLCRIVRESKADLRAVIFELDENCERFDFPAGLPSVKVVIVRQCKSLAVLGLAGLTSLVSLLVEDCPKLRHVEFDPSHTYTLKSVRWVCKDQGLQGSRLEQKLQAGSTIQVKELIKKGWCSMWAFIGGPRRPLNGVMNLASQLKGLQVLRLERTGITRLGDLSSYWPQLRILEVVEDHIEDHIEELGNLPHLKQYCFGDADRSNLTFFFDYQDGGEPRMTKNPSLLADCPELEDVRSGKKARIE